MLYCWLLFCPSLDLSTSAKKIIFHIFPTSGAVGFVHIVQTFRRPLQIHLFHLFKLIFIFQLVHIDHILTFENLTRVYLLSPRTFVIFSPEMFCASFVKDLCRVISVATGEWVQRILFSRVPHWSCHQNTNTNTKNTNTNTNTKKTKNTKDTNINKNVKVAEDS